MTVQQSVSIAGVIAATRILGASAATASSSARCFGLRLG